MGVVDRRVAAGVISSIGLTTAGVLAVLSPTLSVGRAFPQAVRLLCSGASGVSAATWILVLVPSELWCAYGVFAHVPAVIVANVPNGLLALVIVVLVGRRLATTVRLLVTAALLSVGVAVFIVLSVHEGARDIISAVAVAGSVTLYLPQLMKVLREPDVTGASLAAWVLALVSAISWGAYGIVIRNIPVFLPNVVTVPCALVIVWRVARSGGRNARALRNCVQRERPRANPKSPL